MVGSFHGFYGSKAVEGIVDGKSVRRRKCSKLYWNFRILNHRLSVYSRQFLSPIVVAWKVSIQKLWRALWQKTEFTCGQMKKSANNHYQRQHYSTFFGAQLWHCSNWFKISIENKLEKVFRGFLLHFNGWCHVKVREETCVDRSRNNASKIANTCHDKEKAYHFIVAKFAAEFW